MRNSLLHVLSACEFHLAPLLTPESLCAIAVTNHEMLRDVVNRWWNRWTRQAILSLYLLEKTRNLRSLQTPCKLFHIHFDDPTNEWWHSNHMVTIFHWFSRHCASRFRSVRSWRPRKNKPCHLVNRQMKEGNIFDVMDRRGYWQGAVVLCKKQNPSSGSRDAERLVHFRFLGWSCKFNEWISSSEWGTRIAPFGHRSLRWSPAPRLRSRQYCLVHRRQILSTMSVDDQLEVPPENMKVSGYSVAEITRVFRSPCHTKCMVHAYLHVSNGSHVACVRSNPSLLSHQCRQRCERHPIGCTGRTVVLYVRDEDVLPLNDVTATLMLSKHILAEPHFAIDVTRKYRRVVAQAIAQATRQFEKIEKMPQEFEACAVCGQPHICVNPYKRALHRMGACTQAWTHAHHLPT